jgi:hypothetical protein
MTGEKAKNAQASSEAAFIAHPYQAVYTVPGSKWPRQDGHPRDQPEPHSRDDTPAANIEEPSREKRQGRIESGHRHDTPYSLSADTTGMLARDFRVEISPAFT